VLSLKPSIQVTDIRKNSPAELAGVQEGDYLLEVNGKPIYSYSIQDLMSLFYEKEGREIELIVDRNGYRFSFNFKLKKIL
ncbi:MAG: signaling protein, partial [Flavobacteriales bacterium CG_4_8_14_3_um_filter_35_10]